MPLGLFGGDVFDRIFFFGGGGMFLDRKDLDLKDSLEVAPLG